jgi:hypothetical protein
VALVDLDGETMSLNMSVEMEVVSKVKGVRRSSCSKVLFRESWYLLVI